MNCPPLGFFKDSTSMLPKNQAAPCGEDGTNGSGLHFPLIGLAPGVPGTKSQGKGQVQPGRRAAGLFLCVFGRGESQEFKK